MHEGYVSLCGDSNSYPQRILPDKYYDPETSGLTPTIEESDVAREINFDLTGER